MGFSFKSFGQGCKDEWSEAKEAAKELWQWGVHDVQYRKLARKACQWKYWCEQSPVFSTLAWLARANLLLCRLVGVECDSGRWARAP